LRTESVLQRRVLFFVHDGTGLGHLRRTARIAEALQGPCAALLLTGHRTVGWVLPEACEFVHLPSWDALLESQSRRRGRARWLHIEPAEAALLRRRIIEATMVAFQPDAIFMDYLPFGRDAELEELICSHDAKKYLVLRGIIDTVDQAQFRGWSAKVAEHFERVFIAADERVVDVVTEYGLHALSSKTRYVGYVAPPIPAARQELRRRRGLDDDAVWVVCSAGGGLEGESLIERCLSLAEQLDSLAFDIVVGPRSRITVRSHLDGSRRVRLWQECVELPLLHGAADVVVTRGGYNSLVEAMHGGAHVVTCPRQTGNNDEQRTNALRLAGHYPIAVVHDLDLLIGTVRQTVERIRAGCPRPELPLRCGGAEKIRETVWADLGLTP